MFIRGKSTSRLKSINRGMHKAAQQDFASTIRNSTRKHMLDPRREESQVIIRAPSERNANKERLNLDRRSLTRCPVLKMEEKLRLLNYENNEIERISNLEGLPNLIFLDLYNNQIQEIENLEVVPTLRVLMLGRNRIREIKGLSSLTRLDVLDLHGNEISEMKNLDSLRELRVLNLAGNMLSKIENIENLTSLVEVNLRRNKITTIEKMDTLNCMSRIFLSNNDISSLEVVKGLSKLESLTELALDSNPISAQQDYRMSIIRELPSIIHLDLKNVTSQERMMAMSAKEPVPTSAIESHIDIDSGQSKQVGGEDSESQPGGLASTSKRTSSTSEDPKKAEPRSRGGGEPEVMMLRTNPEAEARVTRAEALAKKGLMPSASRFKDGLLDPQKDPESRQAILKTIENQWESRVHENPSETKFAYHEFSTSGETLFMYGWCIPSHLELSHLNAINFFYVEFNVITQHFGKFKTLPNLKTLNFQWNNIHSFYQIDALSVIPHLNYVSFGLSNNSNPIVKVPLYRSYAVFRLSVLSLDGARVLDSERKQAAARFSALKAQWKNRKILKTKGFCPPMLDKAQAVGHIKCIADCFPLVRPKSAETPLTKCLQSWIKGVVSSEENRRRLKSIFPKEVEKYVLESLQEFTEDFTY